MMRDDGLSEYEFKQIISVFDRYPEIDEAVLYGSRAKGDFREQSDIDLAIKGRNLDRFRVSEILLDLMDTDIPYLVDLQDYEEINNSRLKSHIDRVGKVIYRKDPSTMLGMTPSIR